MSKRDAFVVTFRGERFRFYMDQDGTLHITSRHGASPVDAILTYFQGVTTWQEEYMRYQTLTATHGLY